MATINRKQPLPNLSLRKQVVAILRDAILACRLEPGAVLNERDLAEQLGVSKTPVREALSLLNHEGLVQILPRQAYVVTPITVRDVHECFDLRVILECAAVELAAARIGDDELAQLEAIVSGEADTEPSAETLVRNTGFHSLIARASGNERLTILIEKLLGEMPRLITAGYVLGEHESLMKSLRERNPVHARDAMRQHILHVKEKALGAAASGKPRPKADQPPFARVRRWKAARK
ncbi:MAG: GntR family transcriptional regulator [Betaproteobacteria bacterium]|nr:GntR family transcriptional regulator [Betaproteobacteria bacterium]